MAEPCLVLRGRFPELRFDYIPWNAFVESVDSEWPYQNCVRLFEYADIQTYSINDTPSIRIRKTYTPDKYLIINIEMKGTLIDSGCVCRTLQSEIQGTISHHSFIYTDYECIIYVSSFHWLIKSPMIVNTGMGDPMVHGPFLPYMSESAQMVVAAAVCGAQK